MDLIELLTIKKNYEEAIKTNISSSSKETINKILIKINKILSKLEKETIKFSRCKFYIDEEEIIFQDKSLKLDNYNNIINRNTTNTLFSGMKKYSDMMSIEETAEYLDISEELATRLVISKKLKSIKVGRAHRISKKFIIDFISKEDSKFSQYHIKELNNYRDVLTVSELAEYLRVSKDVLLKLLKNGNIKSRMIGRNYRISKRDIVEYIYNIII